MKAKHLTPSHIGTKLTVTQESGLMITATLVSLAAREDDPKMVLFFKELVDQKGQRIRVEMDYEDTVEPYPSRQMAPGGLIR